MCLYPKLIRNKKYVANKKNGGVIPAVCDERVLQVPVGCGRCMECRGQETRKWQVRLLEEVKTAKNGKFITLTFSNKSINELTNAILKKHNKNKDNKKLTKQQIQEKGYELDNEIAKLAMRRFLERWRKEYGKSVRHWFVTELGHEGTEHIHMHGILWTDEIGQMIEKIWMYGYVWYGQKATGKTENFVNEKTVNYIIKYIKKVDKKHEYYKGIVLTSAGIGSKYVETPNARLNKYNGKETRETYKTRSGHDVSMPIYWRNKIYTDEEREKLWLQKLDEEVRYVGGEKVDISKGDKEYYKLLEYYRKKNKRLGYGSDEVNWEKKEYERARRALKIKERIENAKASGGLAERWFRGEEAKREDSGAGRVHPTDVKRDSAIRPDENNFIKNLE